MNFSTDSRFFHIMSRIADCILLSILWFVFSLPVITAGAATSALYYCVIKVLREDQGNTLSHFWKAFRANFKQSTIVTVMALLAVILVLAVSSSVYTRNPSQQLLTNIYLVDLLALLFGAAWLHYVFSSIAKFQNSLGNIFKNSLVLCLVNFPASAFMALLLAAAVVLTILNYPRSLGIMLFLPAGYMLLVSFLLERIYKKYLPQTSEPVSE